MDVIRQAVFTLVVFLAGLVIGAVSMHLHLQPEIAVAQEEAAQWREEVEEAIALREEARAKANQLAHQNETLRDEIDALHHAAAAPQALGAPETSQEPARMPPQNDDELGSLFSALGEAAAKASVRPTPNGTGAPGTESDAMSGEERAAQRSEFLSQVRQRTSDIIEAEAAKAGDPAVRRRLDAIREQSDYMLALMEQIRETRKEDERARLQEAFDAARAEVGALVEEQQDYMLRQVAAQYGITDEVKQAELIRSLRETQSSPLFRAPTLTWGITSANRHAEE